jgi:hypothetical protein
MVEKSYFLRMLMPKNLVQKPSPTKADDFSGYYYSEVLAGFSNWLTSLHANQ